MGDNKVYRVINTVITAAGLLACIASGFIPAPEGLLADGSISVIQALPQRQMLVFFALPALLILVATVLVAMDKLSMVALIAAFAGGCLFASMDIAFISGAQAFEGILLNEAGIVMAVCGALLHAVGMPSEPARKKSKSKAKKAAVKDKAAEAAVPAPVQKADETELYEVQKNFYGGESSKPSSGLAGRETMELGDSLIAALNAITGTDEEQAGSKDIESGLTADAPAAVAAAEESTSADLSGWSSDSELERILKNDFSVKEEDPIAPAPQITAEEIAAAARDDAAETEEKDHNSDDSADFYAELEDMFRIQE